MSKINICFVSDNAVSTIKANLKKFTDIASNNVNDNTLFKKELPDKYYVEKKYEIDDFELKTSDDGNYSKVDFDNALTLYDHLHELPRHILGDERFWLWVIIEKGYKAALQAMPMASGKNIIKDHWLFGQGLRRGLMFGVLSRAYFRVELTFDDSLQDPYELTKFTTTKIERYRNLTWRAYSNNKTIVLGALKAEKKIYDKYGEEVEGIKNYYTEIGKYVSQLGSVMLLDMMEEEYITKKVFDYCEAIINTQNSKVKDE